MDNGAEKDDFVEKKRRWVIKDGQWSGEG